MNNDQLRGEKDEDGVGDLKGHCWVVKRIYPVSQRKLTGRETQCHSHC